MSYLFQTRCVNVITEAKLENSGELSLDIIVLHGLGGTWDESWTINGYCWLSQALATKFPFNRIISLNYPALLRDLAAGANGVEGLVLDLTQERGESGRVDSAVVFVGHSFGGTILKQVYIATHPSSSSNPAFHRFHELLRGYVYLGTPQNDISTSDVSKLWRALSTEAATSLGARSPDLERAIFTTSRINHAFRRLGGEDLPSLCCYETETTLIGISKTYIVTREQATFTARLAESVPLDSRHQNLARFSSDEDSNLLRIIGAFRDLMVTITAIQPRRLSIADSRPDERQRRLRILSLDGGGVKGYFTILVIRRLIDEAHRLEGGTMSRKRPCDYFNLIGGTSTGGLLAIMLGRLQMDANSCVSAYLSLSRKVFSNNRLPFLRTINTGARTVLGYPWFSGDQLKSAVIQTVEENLTASERASLEVKGRRTESLRFASEDIQGSQCFVCAVAEGQRRVERIRNYRSIEPTARDTSRYTIWEAARATSAAPLYFPAIKVQGTTYFDGGLDSNNPVVEVIEEARKEFPGALIDTVVSIGTGKGVTPDPVPPLTNVLYHFINRSTDTEWQHDRVMTEDVFKNIREGYFRFQGETNLGEIDLANADKMDEIETLAQEYLSSSIGRQMIASCAARLVQQD